jgi:hypothetical protein
LGQLSAAAADIQAVRGYLDRVEVSALPDVLQSEHCSLQVRLYLDTLSAQPHLWPSLQAEFERFRAQYRSAYQIHHRDYYRAVQAIGDALTGVLRRLKALELLNRLRDLGQPLGQDLPARYERLRNAMSACDRGVNVQVEAAPVCEVCHLPLSRHAPDDEAISLRRDLEAALAEQVRRLKTEAIRKVLAESSTDRMGQLVQAIELANLDGLVDVLDEGVVRFIAQALEMQGLIVVPQNVLQRLADRYPALEEKEVPAFLSHLEEMLDEAFAAAHQAHPDKRTVRISLK